MSNDSPDFKTSLTKEEKATILQKLKEREAAERTQRADAMQREYRARYRTLNRSERRKLAREISKVERGDYR